MLKYLALCGIVGLVVAVIGGLLGVPGDWGVVVMGSICGALLLVPMVRRWINPELG